MEPSSIIKENHYLLPRKDMNTSIIFKFGYQYLLRSSPFVGDPSHIYELLWMLTEARDLFR